MIGEIKQGDLLLSESDIICHQVNCQGVMGSGIAWLIRNKYAEVYIQYLKYCKEKKSPLELLGDLLMVETSTGVVVANLFGQLTYGKGVQHTEYSAVLKGFAGVLVYAEQKAKEQGRVIRVGIPYLLGCDRGGGDWNVLYPEICEIFKTSTTVCLEVYRFQP